MYRILTFLMVAGLVLTTSSCYRLYDFLDDADPLQPEIQTVLTDLKAPLGMHLDYEGRLWVTEIGTGNNDGQIGVLMPGGDYHVVASGFTSFVNPENELVGLNHLLLYGNTLYALHGPEGRLYMLPLSDWSPAKAPVKAGSLHYQDIGSFVLAYDFEEDTEESNLYNLTGDLKGNLYIADAAANAIIKRTYTGELSVFAAFESRPNPLPFGPPTVQQVPTGIVYDGHNFLVSTLQGFPFPEGFAQILQVDMSGDVSVFQEGLTSMVDIELAVDKSAVVAEFARFGEAGFIPNSGQIVNATPNGNRVLVDDLLFPTDVELELGNPRVMYVNSLAEGTVKKIML